MMIKGKEPTKKMSLNLFKVTQGRKKKKSHYAAFKTYFSSEANV